jgi:hypothetical protein
MYRYMYGYVVRGCRNPGKNSGVSLLSSLDRPLRELIERVGIAVRIVRGSLFLARRALRMVTWRSNALSIIVVNVKEF